MVRTRMKRKIKETRGEKGQKKRKKSIDKGRGTGKK